MKINQENDDRKILMNQYWLSRVIFLRFLGFLYFIAFFVAWNQNESLIGENGLTPAVLFLERYKSRFASNWEAFYNHPTLFWYISPTSENLNTFALIGMILASITIILGSSNVPIQFSLWILYFSIINVGQTWYSFGWESQILETTIISMLGVPLFSLSRYPKYTPTSWVLIWGNRYLLFRIMLGAGMIKIRGDKCWLELTCMNYFYQTQPNPNPLSIYYHNTPEAFHKLETLTNHFVELIGPFLLLIPNRSIQFIGGLIQIIFQFVLISAGNLSFLNWLTILPGIMCFDDYTFSYLFFSQAEVNKCISAIKVYHETVRVDNETESSFLAKVFSYFYFKKSWGSFSVFLRRIFVLIAGLFLLFQSYPVINNILSPNQQMNISFDSFRLVNSYGAFGSVTKVRHEVILEGTKDPFLTPKTKWEEFNFRCKPGDINKTPCFISPYHLRIDWLMWFAAFQNYQQCSWIVNLANKILEGDTLVNSLFDPVDGNPFYHSSDATNYIPPRYIRAVLYEYEYSPLSEIDRQVAEKNGWEVGKWWKRKPSREYMPAIEAKNPSVQQFLQAYGFIKV